MAAVHEQRLKRARRLKQTNGRRSRIKVCSNCDKETRWLSVEGLCWDCTVSAIRRKTPIYIEPQEEESEGIESGTSNEW